jgi:hypothetical protein
MAVTAVQAGRLLCKQAGITGTMGLDGKIYEVADYQKKIRGAAAYGLKHVIVPQQSVKAEGGGKPRLMEPVVNVRTGRLELSEFRVEASVCEGPDAVTAIAADTFVDVMDLLLISNRQGEAGSCGIRRC